MEVEEICLVEEVENKDLGLDLEIPEKEKLMLLKKMKKKQQFNLKEHQNLKVAVVINSISQDSEPDSTAGNNPQLKDQLTKIYWMANLLSKYPQALVVRETDMEAQVVNEEVEIDLGTGSLPQKHEELRRPKMLQVASTYNDQKSLKPPLLNQASLN